MFDRLLNTSVFNVKNIINPKSSNHYRIRTPCPILGIKNASPIRLKIKIYKISQEKYIEPSQSPKIFRPLNRKGNLLIFPEGIVVAKCPKIHRKVLAPESFDKIEVVHPATSLKKRLQCRYFLLSFAKFSKPIFAKHLRLTTSSLIKKVWALSVTFSERLTCVQFKSSVQ